MYDHKTSRSKSRDRAGVHCVKVDLTTIKSTSRVTDDQPGSAHTNQFLDSDEKPSGRRTVGGHQKPAGNVVNLLSLYNSRQSMSSQGNPMHAPSSSNNSKNEQIVFRAPLETPNATKKTNPKKSSLKPRTVLNKGYSKPSKDKTDNGVI